MSEAQELNLDDLQKYIIIGVTKDDGEVVIAASPQLTLPDMGMLLGRANTDLAMHVSRAGAFDGLVAFQLRGDQ